MPTITISTGNAISPIPRSTTICAKSIASGKSNNYNAIRTIISTFGVIIRILIPSTRENARAR